MGSYFSSETPRIVFVEGNIGAGKTSVLKELQKQGHIVICEDVENWTFLSMRYTDPKRWLFTLQIEIAATMQEKLGTALETTPPDKTIFVERSLVSSLLFAEVARDNKIMTAQEFTLLNYLCAKSIEKLNTIRTNTIYLKCNTQTCLERIKYRNRNTETTDISLQYLNSLNTIMDDTFATANLTLEAESPCHTLALRIAEHYELI